MFHFPGHTLTHLLATYGYWAVLLFVAIESTGIPFPGETMLLAAAIYAGTHHSFHIPLVIAAAAAGAILGDNLGFLVGRAGGYRLLRRYGHLVRLDERKLKLGIYLFRRHGGKVVFFGRFVAVLRAWAAFLAGTSRMPWDCFLLFNAARGILWAILYGFGGYALGDNIHRVTGPVGIATVVLAILVIVIVLVVLRRNEERLEEEAERALPGPLTTGQLRASTPDRRVPVGLRSRVEAALLLLSCRSQAGYLPMDDERILARRSCLKRGNHTGEGHGNNPAWKSKRLRRRMAIAVVTAWPCGATRWSR